MKKAALILMLIFAFLAIKAQDDEFQTIGSSTGIKISGFGAPMMSFTQIGGEFVHMMGGGGGVILNDFFIGGYGMGKTNELSYQDNTANVMTFGHGGFWLGYTPHGNKAVHTAFHTQIGWGEINEQIKGWQSQTITPLPLSSDKVFVICPTAELELNFSRFFKLGGGVTYSLVYNTDGPYTFKDFANPGFFVSFKFGYFR
jgi:hypothetical protein